MKRKYRSHNVYVSARVRPENLLIFNVKDGWKPVCDFLGLDMPAGSFPKVNVNGGSDGYMKVFWTNSGFMQKCLKEAVSTIGHVFGAIIIALYVYAYWFSKWF